MYPTAAAFPIAAATMQSRLLMSQVFAINLTGDRKVSSRSGVAVQCLEELPFDHASREIEP
jgi:hypothetical protein